MLRVLKAEGGATDMSKGLTGTVGGGRTRARATVMREMTAKRKEKSCMLV